MSFSLSSLNPQQREAVVTHRGPVLILAGAGTGKTRTLTCRIAHMLQKGIAPGQVLAVTFTNKAAREMAQRVSEMIPRGTRGEDGSKPERPTLCTFHSLCVRILRQHIDRLGYKRNFVIYDEGDQLAAMKKILSGISAKGEKTDASAVLSVLSKFKNSGPDSANFADPSIRALAEHVAKKYESALRACNAVDFDDLILLTLRLFREHPDALELCRQRWPYVMVDEYQDTNGSQFALVQHLTSESRNLCVVGDDDQSIYGWRGAEIANILDLEKHYPEVKIIKLEQNYRSTNIILKAANAVIKNNARRRGKNLWSDKPAGDKIVLTCFADDDKEAETVAADIEYDRVAKRATWGQQAVLFRTNMQARPIETALRKKRIRYRLIGGQSFFDRREIKEFLAFLKTFVNPHDDIGLLRIANIPARGLSDVTMERLLAASAERKSSVFTVMRHTDVLDSFQTRTRESITGFVAWLEKTRQPLLVDEPISLGNWAAAWVEEIGLYNEFRKHDKDPETAENRVKNVKELLGDLDGPKPAVDQEKTATRTPPPGTLRPKVTRDEILKQVGPATPPPPVVYAPRYHGKPMDRLDDYLAEITLDSEREDEKEDQGDVVTLITMHAVKGLEFPHVHIVGVEEGLLPHSRSKVEGTLDEERRLFYVGITRAQETLRLSHCTARRRYGQLMPCHPSSFLRELPEDCVISAEEGDSTFIETGKGDDYFAVMRAALED